MARVTSGSSKIVVFLARIQPPWRGAHHDDVVRSTNKPRLERTDRGIEGSAGAEIPVVDQLFSQTPLQIGNERPTRQRANRGTNGDPFMQMRVHNVRLEVPDRPPGLVCDYRIEQHPTRAWTQRALGHAGDRSRPPDGDVDVGTPRVRHDQHVDTQGPQRLALFVDPDVTSAIAEERRRGDDQDAKGIAHGASSGNVARVRSICSSVCWGDQSNREAMRSAQRRRHASPG